MEVQPAQTGRLDRAEKKMFLGKRSEAEKPITEVLRFSTVVPQWMP